MKNWFVRGLVWTIVAFAAFALTLTLSATADGAAFDVPVWVPFAGMSLVFMGGSVLRRGLLDQND